MLQAEGLNPQAQRVRVLAPPKPHHPSPPKPQPALPPSPLQPSRFAHPNPFQPLSNDTFPPDPSHPSDFVSPFCLDSDCLDLPPSPVRSPSLSRSVSWSDPLVTLSVSQKFSAYPSSHPNRNTTYIKFLLHRDPPSPAHVNPPPPQLPSSAGPHHHISLCPCFFLSCSPSHCRLWLYWGPPPSFQLPFSPAFLHSQAPSPRPIYSARPLCLASGWPFSPHRSPHPP